MAELGSMLASAVVSMLKKQIGSAIGGQITLQMDLSKDLRRMAMTLESVEAVLRDAERRSVGDAAVRLWLKRLEDAAYDISGMLDELEGHGEEGIQTAASEDKFVANLDWFGKERSIFRFFRFLLIVLEVWSGKKLNVYDRFD
uniref:Disease resistance N-terminal domain-containing protein n=1 Tax=Oryza brachyantha TaxID=4533 RepID=J3N6T6_ORYBR